MQQFRCNVSIFLDHVIAIKDVIAAVTLSWRICHIIPSTKQVIFQYCWKKRVKEINANDLVNTKSSIFYYVRIASTNELYLKFEEEEEEHFTVNILNVSRTTRPLE